MVIKIFCKGFLSLLQAEIILIYKLNHTNPKKMGCIEYFMDWQILGTTETLVERLDIAKHGFPIRSVPHYNHVFDLEEWADSIFPRSAIIRLWGGTPTLLLWRPVRNFASSPRDWAGWNQKYVEQNGVLKHRKPCRPPRKTRNWWHWRSRNG